MLTRTRVALMTVVFSVAIFGCKPPEFAVYEITIDNCKAQTWRFPEKAGEKSLGLIEKNHTNQPETCQNVVVYRIEKGEQCAAAVNYVKVSQMGDACRLQLAVRKKICSKAPANVTDEAQLAAETLINGLAVENPVLKTIVPKSSERKIYDATNESQFKELVNAWCQ